MAKGFQRQGDWQTGYVQRSVPTRDAKVAEQRAIQLAKKADEETKKRVQSAKELEAEAARIFQVQTGLDRYEAQKAADMSATFKNFMTKTVTSIAKTAQDQARAEGAADAILEDETPTETVATSQALEEITAASNKNIEISTKVEKEIAEPLEKIGELDKANKARGIFSSAYKFGYESKRASLAVDGFAAKLRSELDSSEVLLQRKDDDVPWRIKDAKTKDQLRFASGYLLNEFIEEERGTLGDITVAELIGKPAKKAISKELKTRYDAIDLEFKENQIAAITNHLGASMEMLPGAATLTTDLKTLEARLRPHLTATATKSKGALLKGHISTTFKDVIGRSSNPELVKDNFIKAATTLKLNTSMGVKTLAEIDKSLFGKDAINAIFTEEMSKRYAREVSGQKQAVTLAIINKSEEIAKDMADTGKSIDDYSEEMLLFKASLYKEYTYAAGEITNLMEKFFIPTLSDSDTILAIKRSLESNGGVVKLSDLDQVNMKVAQDYIEDNKLEIMDQPYTEVHKDHIRVKEGAAKKLFQTINKQGGVVILHGNEQEALDQFNWEVNQKALGIVRTANQNNVTMTYQTAYDQAWGEMYSEVQAGRSIKESRWYVTSGEGFKYFDKANVNPFYTGLEDLEVWKNVTIKSNGKNGRRLATKELWIKDPTRLTVNQNGYSDDPLVQRVSRLLGISENDFIEAQKQLFPKGTFDEQEVDEDEGNQLIKDNAQGSNSTKEVLDLSSKGNADSKIVLKACDECLPLSPVILKNHFLDYEDEILRNRITAPGLFLGKGQTKVIDGEKFTGHRVIGVSDPYGLRDHPTTGEKDVMHTGVDIGTTYTKGWQTAFAITDGEVIANQEHKNYGNYIDIRDNETGNVYRFAHLKNYNPELKVGAKYNGQIIGEIGNTGRSTGEHLHLEKIVDGKQVDPTDELDRLSIGKTIDNGEGFIGKYPLRANLLARASRHALGRRFPVSKKEFINNEAMQDKVWLWLNEESWPTAVEAAKGDLHLAVRLNTALIITGEMDNYTNPTVWSYTDTYLENLRRAGVLK